MEKIGFFGGCFNPPSNIHINLAKELVKNKLLDKVVFVPVGDYYKKQSLIDAKHRYNMLLLACNDCNYFDVEDVDVKSKKTLYASDTFKLIYDKYNSESVEIYFIMGSDNFAKMSTWKDYDEIIKLYRYVVIERPNYKENVNQSNIIYYKLEQKEDMSATKIRNLIKNKKETTLYLNNKVAEYIKENKLYE